MSEIRTAMILAAGRGERLRPLTDKTPKPLISVAGKPLIIWHIERLSRAGFKKLVINHAHLGHQLVDRIGDGSQWGVNVSYSAEAPQALETGGGIKKALPLLGAEPFLVVNGDIWCDYEFSDLSLPDDKLAHLILVNNPEHHPFGDFALEKDSNLVVDKPRFTFSGIGLYSPKLFVDSPEGAFPLAPLLRLAMTVKKVTGQLHQGYWSDVGTMERLAQTDSDVLGF